MYWGPNSKDILLHVKFVSLNVIKDSLKAKFVKPWKLFLDIPLIEVSKLENSIPMQISITWL